MSDHTAHAHITKDEIYSTVDRDDLASMLAVDRYAGRSNAFDAIISATHDHFWDPLDKRYVDFDQPFDLENEMLLPEHMMPELQTVIGDRLQGRARIAFVNESARWMLSSILHGEQAALSLSANLCLILHDQGAQEYAANQAREEARHVTAFSRYVQARWGTPLPISPMLGNLLSELVSTPEVYKKIIGMQMLVEGLAMGSFATLFQHARDPLLRHISQLVMTDEAFHHKFGKIWAERTVPKLSQEEHERVEDWAAEVFQVLLFNLASPEEKAPVLTQFGFDPHEIQRAMAQAYTDDDRRARMQDSTHVFRVLIKTLLKAGIITERTRPLYAIYVNMDELKDEGDRMVGDSIAEDGIAFLQRINVNRRGGIRIAAE